MSLQVDFSDYAVCELLDRQLGQVYKKRCELVRDVSNYEQLTSDDPDVTYHIDGVLKCKDIRHREYVSLFGAKMDTHSELEKIGVCRHVRDYIILISLEDSLDYILHRLTGLPSEVFRRIPNYYDLSRSILKMDFDRLDNYQVSDLFTPEGESNGFFAQLYEEAAATGEEDVGRVFIQNFITRIFTEVTAVLNFITVGFYVKGKPQDPNLVWRSKSSCSSVLTGDVQHDTKLELIADQYEPLKLKIMYLKPREYLERANERFS